MTECILFIFEGDKTEKTITDSLLKFYIKNDKRIVFSSFKTDIYALYKMLSEDEDLDVFAIIKERNPELNDYTRDSFSQLFLFFDYDGHSPAANDDKIIELLDFFNEETENGKLFISYPMVEAFKYFKCCNDIESFLDFKIDRVDVNRFKQISHEHSDQSRVLKRMQKEDFQHLIYLHCLKAHYLVNNIKDVVEEYVDQDQIFKVFDQSSNIPVLSSFPQLLKYFYKFEDFLELVEIKKS